MFSTCSNLLRLTSALAHMVYADLFACFYLSETFTTPQTHAFCSVLTETSCLHLSSDQFYETSKSLSSICIQFATLSLMDRTRESTYHWVIVHAFIYMPYSECLHTLASCWAFAILILYTQQLSFHPFEAPYGFSPLTSPDFLLDSFKPFDRALKIRDPPVLISEDFELFTTFLKHAATRRAIALIEYADDSTGSISRWSFAIIAKFSNKRLLSALNDSLNSNLKARARTEAAWRGRLRRRRSALQLRRYHPAPLSTRHFLPSDNFYVLHATRSSTSDTLHDSRCSTFDENRIINLTQDVIICDCSEVCLFCHPGASVFWPGRSVSSTPAVLRTLAL